MKKVLPFALVALVAVGAMIGLALALLPKDIMAGEEVASVAKEPPPEIVQTMQTSPPVSPQPTPVRTTHAPVETTAETAGEAPQEVEVRPPRPTPAPKVELPPASVPDIDASQSGAAIVSVRVNSDKKTKVRIAREGKNYDYNLISDGFFTTYPLNMGTGEYKVVVYENVVGDKFRPVVGASFVASWEDPNTPFLQSTQSVDWSADMLSIYDASWMAVTAHYGNATSEIFDSLAYSLAYDYSLVNKLPKGYLPNIEKTYDTKLGICHDFSALYAAMLRSVGVPAKLMKGTSTLVEGPHAWNEVLVEGEWKVVDLTVNVIYKEHGKAVEFAQDSSKYFADRLY